ncbi:MAG: hypothetical protein A2583_04575 [Bdellovibrionales bacterium RIFOXYD1_FULL_53_11]|nr:MAG: hypothetical protein A2583_04575 [Bdellovibrionales bacterium RIFOXYD1_FULL_53_11]
MITSGFFKGDLAYTGVELRPHFLLSRFGLKGSAVGAFAGPCSVKTEHLVDWEDRLENDRIEAALMLHFIGEFFGVLLREGVLMQRLFMSIAGEEIERAAGRVSVPARFGRIERRGDDLFALGRKLSVSIVTASPVSVLMHAGINIDPSGAPVPAVGLGELGFETGAIEPLARGIMERFAAEARSIDWACAKVRPVV